MPEAVGNGGDAPWHAGLDQWRLQVCGPPGLVKNLGLVLARGDGDGGLPSFRLQL